MSLYDSDMKFEDITSDLSIDDLNNIKKRIKEERMKCLKQKRKYLKLMNKILKDEIKKRKEAERKEAEHKEEINKREAERVVPEKRNGGVVREFFHNLGNAVIKAVPRIISTVATVIAGSLFKNIFNKRGLLFSR